MTDLQIIMIDNFDSFTYNLVDQLKQITNNVVVFRNDVAIENIFTEQRLANKKTIIVISPGPGNPDSAGNTLAIIKRYAGVLPILGICLGHQSIVQHYGGVIGQAKKIIHGKADDIFLEKNSLFANISNPFRAARYHSLVATNIPESLSVIARSSDEIMAVQNIQDKVLGFQFHPESILTTQGALLLKSSLSWLSSEL